MKVKNVLAFICVLFLSVCCSNGLFAQVDNLTNMSADWVRMSNRNAATDAADIVVYNPAGLTKMADGFHLNFGNQMLFRKPEHTFDLGLGFGQKTLSQADMDPFLPNLYMAYKKGRLALFGGIYIPGGGAVVSYPDGSITSHLLGFQSWGMAQFNFDGFKDSLEATSMYLTTTAGAAYAVTNWLSVSAGVRYINATNTFQAKVVLIDSTGMLPNSTLRINAKDTAGGLGGVFGINLSMNKLNIGVHYETKVKLDFETDVEFDSFNGGVATDGAKSRRDFPAMLGIGVSYQFSPKLRLEADYNLFFQKDAEWDSSDSLSYKFNYWELAGNCYSFGAAAIYNASDSLELSAGFLYTIFDWQDIELFYTSLGAFEVLYSDNWNLALGFSYKASRCFSLTAGVNRTFWKDENLKAYIALPFDVNVQTKNSTYVVALGFNLTL